MNDSNSYEFALEVSYRIINNRLQKFQLPYRYLYTKTQLDDLVNNPLPNQSVHDQCVMFGTDNRGNDVWIHRSKQRSSLLNRMPDILLMLLLQE